MEAKEYVTSTEVEENIPSPMPLVVGRFLRALFPEMAEGEQMELRAISNVGVARVRTAFFTGIGPLWERAVEWRDRGDVYIGVAPRRGNMGTAAGVTRLHCIWGDFDFKGEHTHDTRRQQLRTLECRPSMVVNSGKGFHAYWLLEKPVEAKEEMQRAVNIMRRMAVELECDNVGDTARILRLPCTLNYKYDPPVEVIVAGYEPYRRYTLAQLEGMLSPLPPASPAAVANYKLQITNYELKEGEADQQPRQPQPIRNSSFVIRNSATASLLDTAQTLQGVPEGQRDITLFRLACKLRHAGVPQDMAARLIIEAASNCTPPFPARDAVEKVVRAYRKYPSGPEERWAMEEEEERKADPAFKALAQGSGTGQSREVLEESGDELVRSAREGGAGMMDPPSLSFLGQPGYIIEGWSHLLAGYPRCGKTELLVRLCADWVRDGHSVVYLTEEPRSIWQHRLARLATILDFGMPILDCNGKESEPTEPIDPDPKSKIQNLKLLRVVFSLGVPIDLLFKRAFGGTEQIVVIDTMRNLLQLTDETDNSRIAAVLNPWIGGARLHNKTLVISHHQRKGAGEHGEGIAGGHAMLGVFDIALVVKRDEHKKNRRKVEAFARLIEPPEMIYELEEDGTMKSLGDPASLQLADVVERVRAVVGDEWEKTSEIREALGEPLPSLSQVREALTKLAAKGVIERDPPISEQSINGRTLRWKSHQT